MEIQLGIDGDEEGRDKELIEWNNRERDGRRNKKSCAMHMII